MEDITDIIGDYTVALDTILNNLEGVGISIKGKEIDHLAARPKTNKEYEAVKTRLINIGGTLLVEKLIQNRKVCIIKLPQPLKYKEYGIPCLEVLAPIEGGKTYGRLLEHIEIVVGDEPLKSIMARYPNLEFITSNMDRNWNPELIITFPNDANAKFHPFSIEKVLEEEKKLL